ncbi:hypothetical protein RH831_10680 [Halodesulfurarchaeum sp. HSR-GB]|uniref:hypothetical protein n=1 Tax=Halodesulfurarchaeum sp. HSR-GB TaxID=3074077 RepID=UPI00285DDB6B|nr:hypothetical protein [Halodesulfurarchaeum sp. HSR-GB]MDR5657642.1 hypothetical protein [Halodesulfurarchaeum sp. HSR-GB]
MSEVIPKDVHTVGSVPELLDAFDAEDLQDELAKEVDDMSMLTEPVIKEALKQAPEKYVWDYIPPEYPPTEVKIFELPVTTWSDISGVTANELPDICPACEDSHHFDVLENRKDGVSYNGKNDTFHHDQTVEVRYSQVECAECGTLLIEDGELQL